MFGAATFAYPAVRLETCTECLMPTVLKEGPHRLFYFSDEGDPREPPHAHVAFNEKIARFCLQPVALDSSKRLRAREIKQVAQLVELHQARFLRHGMRTLNLEAGPFGRGPDPLVGFIPDRA